MPRFFRAICSFTAAIILAMSVLLSHFTIVHAEDAFTVNLHSSYDVQNSGVTLIKHEFELTNQTPVTYAKNYAFTINATQLKNLKVTTGKDSLPVEIQNTTNQSTVNIFFPDKIVGQGKKRQFTMEYQSTDTAHLNGQVIEVYVPKLNTPEHYSEYKVTIITPNEFGKPVRTRPENESATTEGGQIKLDFDNVKGESITALYGKKQTFDFRVKYQLENTTGNNTVIQVALPPDTSYQKVRYQKLEPEPDQIHADADGNWIATYQVEADRKTEIELEGKVSISLLPQSQVPFTQATNQWLRAQEYWPVDNAKIKELARQYTTPEAIYTYVKTTLKYDYPRVQAKIDRLGALTALEHPDQAACQEFTDLFITIARAAGIPARRVTGYAYSENNQLRPLSLVTDVLHAWPEYYDSTKQTWIQVDPTWENTTGGVDYFHQLDFNHFVFAINGLSSTQPYPAGMYKPVTSNEKLVKVQYGQENFETTPKLAVRVERQKVFGLPLGNQFQLVVKNQTGQAWYDLPLHLSNPPNVTTTLKQDKIAQLLPFQELVIPFSSRAESWVKMQPFTLTANIGGISSHYELNAGPYLFSLLNQITVTIGVGACLVVLTIFTGSLLVRRRRRQRTLRR
jgi:transglutaminase-like putative cysteine protease